MLEAVADVFRETGAKAQGFANGNPNDPDGIVGILIVSGGKSLARLQQLADELVAQAESTDIVQDSRRDFDQ